MPSPWSELSLWARLHAGSCPIGIALTELYQNFFSCCFVLILSLACSRHPDYLGVQWRISCLSPGTGASCSSGLIRGFLQHTCFWVVDNDSMVPCRSHRGSTWLWGSDEGAVGAARLERAWDEAAAGSWTAGLEYSDNTGARGPIDLQEKGSWDLGGFSVCRVRQGLLWGWEILVLFHPTCTETTP